MSPNTSKRKPRQFLPQVEHLEDRCLLSTGLDSSLGTGGIVSLPFAWPVRMGYGAALQPDGKIVAVGLAAARSSPDTPFAGGFAVSRCNADGTPDTTFGAGGLVTTELGADSSGARAVLVQPDGKILVAGEAPGTGGAQDIALARYNPDGSLDAGFGTGGKVVTDLGASTLEGATGIALSSGGAILVVGTLNHDFVVLRYTAGGILDTGFGANGLVSTDFSSGEDRATGVVVQADGKIVVAGISNADFAVARYEADGSLDAGFGAGGAVLTRFDATHGSTRAAIALQSDGKIVVAGAAFTNLQPNYNEYDFAILRYNPNGSLDSSFGRGGQVTTDFGRQDFADTLAIQPDGKIVVAGVWGPLEGTPPSPLEPNPTRNFAAARYNPDGGLDPLFGIGGKVQPPAGAVAQAVLLQPDGKVLLAGSGGTTLDLVRFRDTTKETFVTGLYQDLLGRESDPGGFAFWVGLLEQGAGRADIVRAFQHCPEYYRREVRQLYHDLLRREPDGAGQNHWVEALNAGATQEQLQARFLASEEYFQGIGTGTPAGLLTALYQDVMHRAIDASGLNRHGNALAAGITRTEIAQTILASPEGHTVALDALYSAYLHRHVDASGFDAYLPALQAGVPEETIAMLLLSSEEYLQSH